MPQSLGSDGNLVCMPGGFLFGSGLRSMFQCCRRVGLGLQIDCSRFRSLRLQTRLAFQQMLQRLENESLFWCALILSELLLAFDRHVPSWSKEFNTCSDMLQLYCFRLFGQCLPVSPQDMRFSTLQKVSESQSSLGWGIPLSSQHIPPWTLLGCSGT